MTDTFGTAPVQMIDPAVEAFEVTPNDAEDLTQVTRGLLVGTEGNVTVTMKSIGSGPVTLFLAAGVVHPLRVKRVFATGTAASGIVGLV